MIRESVLPELASDNLKTAALVRAFTIVAEVAASERKTKIVIDRIGVRADELVAAVASEACGFVGLSETSCALVKEIKILEHKALAAAAVPQLYGFYAELSKLAKACAPKPGTREKTYLAALESSDKIAALAASECKLFLSLASSEKPKTILSPSALKSLAEYFSAVANARRLPQQWQKVDYSVTELCLPPVKFFAELSEPGSKNAAEYRALRLALVTAEKTVTLVGREEL